MESAPDKPVGGQGAYMLFIVNVWSWLRLLHMNVLMVTWCLKTISWVEFLSSNSVGAICPGSRLHVIC